MAHHTPDDTDLWKSWLRDGNDYAADRLVEYYMYLVTYHVERTFIHLPNSVQKEELESFGMMGLYDAIRKYDIKRDLKFDTYASFRVRGSIIDGLRQEDWLPRTIRDKAKKIEKTSQDLEQQIQRMPSSEEIANELNMTEQEVEQHATEVWVANVLSIDEKPDNETSDYKTGIGYTIPDQNTQTPEEHIQMDEMKEELTESIQQLNSNEQLVLSLFYDDDLTLTEIGKAMELTTSRISQIHKKAIFKLRHILQKFD